MSKLEAGTGKRGPRVKPQPPGASVPLSQMAVSEDEIAAVEAFLGLHFATIFGHRDGKENPAGKKAANGG